MFIWEVEERRKFHTQEIYQSLQCVKSILSREFSWWRIHIRKQTRVETLGTENSPTNILPGENPADLVCGLVMWVYDLKLQWWKGCGA